MRTLGLILTGSFLVAPVCGQTLTLGSRSTAAGSTVDLALALSRGSSITTLQFTLTYASDDFHSINVKTGAAAAAAGKTLSCTTSPGRTQCMVWGLSNATIRDGEVAVVTAAPSAATNTAVRVIQVAATAVSGGALNIAVETAHGSVQVSGTSRRVSPRPASPPPPRSIQAAMPHPVLASIVCTPSTLRRGETSACTVSMTAPVYGRVRVFLESSNPALSMPASVTIAPGQTSVQFPVTPGGAAVKGTATLRGTFDGVSATAAVTW